MVRARVPMRLLKRCSRCGAIAVAACAIFLGKAAIAQPASNDVFDLLYLSGNDRLISYAFLSTGSAAQAKDLGVSILKKMGFGQQPRWQQVARPQIYPVAGYDRNFNGGIPNSEFKSGGLAFVVDPKIVAVAAPFLGFGISGSTIGTPDNGLFDSSVWSIETSYSASWRFAPSAKMHTADGQIESCLNKINSVSEYGFGCASLGLQTDAIQSTGVASLKLGQHLEYSTTGALFEFSPFLQLTSHREFGDLGYSQPTLGFELTSLQPSLGLITVGASLSSSVQDKMATLQTAHISFQRRIDRRPIKVDLSLQHSAGGLFLGKRRDDVTTFLSISMQVAGGVWANLGITFVNSNADLYDDTGANVSLSWHF